MNALEKFYGAVLEVCVLLDKYFEHINTIKNYFREKYEARFTDYRRVIIRILEVYISRKVARIPQSKQGPFTDKSDLLVSSDLSLLYPSALGSS